MNLEGSESFVEAQARLPEEVISCLDSDVPVTIFSKFAKLPDCRQAAGMFPHEKFLFKAWGFDDDEQVQPTQREKCNGRRNPHYSCWSYDATVAQVAVFVVLRQVYALQKARIVKQATLQSFRF